MSQVIRLKSDLKNAIYKLKKSNASIGLVPTMGALHQGHLELVQLSMERYDVSIATIFVNPIQFNKKEDLEKYPKTEQADIQKLEEVGCDYIFIPNAAEIYEYQPKINLNFGYLEQILEGKHRPGHFNGVGIIVMKLFGLVNPDGAFFGQKDLQQFAIISALVTDFDLPFTLHLAPTVREASGLAMSSRNKRLGEEELKTAGVIYSTLQSASKQLVQGVSQNIILEDAMLLFKNTAGIELEYFEIVDAKTLQHKSVVNEGDRLALCAAAVVAGVRLIDNIIIEI